MSDEVRLEWWTDDDLPVLVRQNAPAMMTFLGGPETDEKVRSRHELFLREQGSTAWPFTIRTESHPDPVGSVVFWHRDHHDEPGYEMGWAIIDEHQGHGYGSRGIRLALQQAAGLGDRARRAVWAFPRVDHPASNGIARAAGFENTGEEGFEYPKGTPITVNAWRFDLDALR